MVVIHSEEPRSWKGVQAVTYKNDSTCLTAHKMAKDEVVAYLITSGRGEN